MVPVDRLLYKTYTEEQLKDIAFIYTQEKSSNKGICVSDIIIDYVLYKCKGILF